MLAEAVACVRLLAHHKLTAALLALLSRLITKLSSTSSDVKWCLKKPAERVKQNDTPMSAVSRQARRELLGVEKCQETKSPSEALPRRE